MIEITTRAFADGLQLLEAAIVQASGLAMREAVRATADTAKATRLGQHRKRPNPIESIYQGPRSALVIAHGIQPYTITARNAKVLRFEVNGQVLYRRMVRNPGLKPEPYVRGAIERGQQVLAYGMEYYLNEAIRRAR
jgi:hypothetical protein